MILNVHKSTTVVYINYDLWYITIINDDEEEDYGDGGNQIVWIHSLKVLRLKFRSVFRAEHLIRMANSYLPHGQGVSCEVKALFQEIAIIFVPQNSASAIIVGFVDGESIGWECMG